MIYCYIRVSTGKQEHLRQINILKEKNWIENETCKYLIETGTGTTLKGRPVLKNLLEIIEKGDTIVTTELSRISRSVKDFSNLIDYIIKEKQANLIIIKENFSLYANGNMDAMTRLIIHITSAFAEFERDLISDRTKESLKAKKTHGTILGKPRGEHSTKENLINTIEYMVVNNVGQKKASLKTFYPEQTFKKDIKKCYEKYNTKDYKVILEELRKEV